MHYLSFIHFYCFSLDMLSEVLQSSSTIHLQHIASSALVRSTQWHSKMNKLTKCICCQPFRTLTSNNNSWFAFHKCFHSLLFYQKENNSFYHITSFRCTSSELCSSPSCTRSSCWYNLYSCGAPVYRIKASQNIPIFNKHQSFIASPARSPPLFNFPTQIYKTLYRASSKKMYELT